MTPETPKTNEGFLDKKDLIIAKLRKDNERLNKIINSLDVDNPDAVDALLNTLKQQKERIKELESSLAEKEKRIEVLEEALERIIQDNLHAIEPGGGCVRGCEYNSSNIPCIIDTAKEALSLSIGG